MKNASDSEAVTHYTAATKCFVELGALAPKIRDQIPELTPSVADTIQRKADAITLLNLHGIITPSEVTKARSRLVKSISIPVKV